MSNASSRCQCVERDVLEQARVYCVCIVSTDRRPAQTAGGCSDVSDGIS